MTINWDKRRYDLWVKYHGFIFPPQVPYLSMNISKDYAVDLIKFTNLYDTVMARYNEELDRYNRKVKEFNEQLESKVDRRATSASKTE